MTMSKRSDHNRIKVATMMDAPIISRIMSFLTLEQSIRYFSPLSKSMHTTAYESITDLTLSHKKSWRNLDNINVRIRTLTSMLNNLKSLTIDGFHEFDDVAFINLLHNNTQNTFIELHIRSCGIVVPLIKNDTLKVLKISTCNNLSSIAVRSTSLETFEAFDCDFKREPTLKQCTSLVNIKLVRWKSLTELKFSSMLEQFSSGSDNNQLVGDQGNKLIYTIRHVGQPQILRTLHLIDCEPIQDPFVENISLVDLRFINCISLRNPSIMCPMLQNLQLTRCENLTNLSLQRCVSLKTIDLTGAGLSSLARAQAIQAGFESVRDKIVASIRHHYSDQITVSY
ncbi:hypothetical protein AKO1_004567 [Acrasis kona]|uniref:Uncharacterized protein n=1 Tax=Acrasis kona TaxID=1008807 RepID=A0AAW2Z3P1_9EUKA